MTVESAKKELNHSGGLSLAERRVIKNAIDVIYADTGADDTGYVNATDVALTTPAGAGITDGTGTVYKSSVTTVSGGEVPIIVTRIFVDLTGLGTSTTDLDIIGTGTGDAHLGRITTAQNGVIFAGTVTCLEAPATGADDIDFYSATVATGSFDDGIAALSETALLTAGSAWTTNEVQTLTGWPPADDYLYLCNGEAGTVGVYTAGKFLIELKGTSL